MAETLQVVHNGFVVQTFDPQTKTFVSQEFVSEDSTSYENSFSEPLDEGSIPEEMKKHPALEMVQPNAEIIVCMVKTSGGSYPIFYYRGTGEIKVTAIESEKEIPWDFRRIA